MPKKDKRCFFGSLQSKLLRYTIFSFEITIYYYNLRHLYHVYRPFFFESTKCGVYLASYLHISVV